MAKVYKLTCTYSTADGSKAQHSFSYVKPPEDITATQLKTFMNAEVTNGSIFRKPPVAPLSAKIVATEETVYDLEE